MLKHSEIGALREWYNFLLRVGGALSAGCRLCMCWRYCFMLKLCWHVHVKFFAEALSYTRDLMVSVAWWLFNPLPVLVDIIW
jgi:hypothetical protein